MGHSSLTERVAEKLSAINRDLGGGSIGGFWVRPDPDSDQDVAVVLILDAIDEADMEASVSRSADVCELVADALEGIIATSCWFGLSKDLEQLGPPLDPEAFHPLRPAA